MVAARLGCECDGINLTYGGTISETAGDTLDLSGGWLTLTGSDAFSGGTIDGSNRLYAQGTTLITDGLTIGGTASLQITKTLTQSDGAVTVGDNAGNKAVLYNTSTGTYAISDDSGINRGSSTASYIANAGLFEKTGGTATSAIAAVITNSGTIKAASGTLDLKAAVSGIGTDVISGASRLEFDAGVAAGQTVEFTASTGELLVGAPTSFDGEISGFDTASAGLNDVISLLGSWSATSFTENSADSGGALALSSGSTHLILNFSGDYRSGMFSAKSAGGSTVIKFA